jgi:hypothetical protein
VSTVSKQYFIIALTQRGKRPSSRRSSEMDHCDRRSDTRCDASVLQHAPEIERDTELIWTMYRLKSSYPIILHNFEITCTKWSTPCQISTQSPPHAKSKSCVLAHVKSVLLGQNLSPKPWLNGRNMVSPGAVTAKMFHKL